MRTGFGRKDGAIPREQVDLEGSQEGATEKSSEGDTQCFFSIMYFLYGAVFLATIDFYKFVQSFIGKLICSPSFFYWDPGFGALES